MKYKFGLMVTSLLALSFQAHADAIENLSCGNSKATVEIQRTADRDGSTTDVEIQMYYADWKGGNSALVGHFNSADPSFQVDANGFQSIYVNDPKNEDSVFFTGKIKINDADAANLTINVDGKVQFGSQAPQLPVKQTLICVKY